MTEFEGQIKELSRLIYNWNLINVNSKSQFNHFSKNLLNALHKGEDVEKISQIIKSELCVTFGLCNTEFNSNILEEQIMQWQNK